MLVFAELPTSSEGERKFPTGKCRLMRPNSWLGISVAQLPLCQYELVTRSYPRGSACFSNFRPVSDSIPQFHPLGYPILFIGIICAILPYNMLLWSLHRMLNATPSLFVATCTAESSNRHIIVHMAQHIEHSSAHFTLYSCNTLSEHSKHVYIYEGNKYVLSQS